MRRALAVLLLAAAVALVPAPARAAAPDAAGWWNAAHRAAVPVVPPAPPDVEAGDLLLQGGDPGRALDPGAAPAPSAYAALRFAVPEGATVGALTLALRAGAQAADVRAYATSTSWKPVENGAIEDAPAPDLSRYAVSTLSADGSALAFPDIGKLLGDDGVLSVALVPGPADRLVVARPTAAALAITPPASDGPALEPVPPVVPVVPLAPAVPAVAPVPGGLAPAAPLPARGPTVAATSPVPAPQLPAQPVQAAGLSRRIVADDARTRVLVGIEALLVVVFFGLLGQGPLGVLARLTGQPVAVVADRGIGRFRAAREGAVPRL